MICDDVSFYPHNTLCSFGNFLFHIWEAKVTDSPLRLKTRGPWPPCADALVCEHRAALQYAYRLRACIIDAVWKTNGCQRQNRRWSFCKAVYRHPSTEIYHSLYINIHTKQMWLAEEHAMMVMAGLRCAVPRIRTATQSPGGWCRSRQWCGHQPRSTTLPLPSTGATWDTF